MADGASKLRPLLPKRAQRSPSKAIGPLPRPRSNLVPAACVACRKRKTKCSGERPTCRHCFRQRIQCHYTTESGETNSKAVNRKLNDLQARAAALGEIIDLLTNLPESDAQGILQRLRSKCDPEAILNHVKAGDLLVQMSVMPDTRLRYEFPYGTAMPEDHVPNNPYLDTLIYGSASLYPTHGSTNSGLMESRPAGDQIPYLSPLQAGLVIDARLSDVKISSWTTVCNDDVLMRDLIRTFFRCEYSFTAAFQKDLFLEDMAIYREEFCSSLLVNIILGYSCICYPQFSNRAEYWNPHTLSYRFLAEAKRLWELEATKPRLTTVQAGILFNVFYNLCGLDSVGQAYRTQAIDLAIKLKLFDSAVQGFSERTRRGRAFTAWSLYNWESLVAFSFLFSPLLKKPPDWHLPDPSEDVEWYGEIWIRYPMRDLFVPSSFGHVFKAQSEFRIIMNDFCQAAYLSGPKMTWHGATEFLLRLKSWHHGLSGPLLPKLIFLPSHLQLHMYYHHLILTLFEPLLGCETDHEPSPEQIVADAKKYLQTLVRIYYLRHGFEAMDLFIVIPLMLIGSDCIDAITDRTPVHELETLRSTLLLVAKGLHDQRRNHYLAEALYRITRGRMRPAEVSLLNRTSTWNEDAANEKSNMAQAIRSHWPVSVVKQKEDLDSLNLTNLVENYAHLNVGEDAKR